MRRLSSSLIALTTNEIVARVGCIPGSLGDPAPGSLDALYTFLNEGALRQLEPMKSMNSAGTWDYPLLVVRSPDGFLVHGDRYASTLWLIEGHQRLRYLKVLQHRNATADVHAVIELGYTGPSAAVASSASRARTA